MVGQTRAMLETTPPDGRYRETVIDHSNMYHRPRTDIHPCGKGSNIRLMSGTGGRVMFAEAHKGCSATPVSLVMELTRGRSTGLDTGS